MHPTISPPIQERLTCIGDDAVGWVRHLSHGLRKKLALFLHKLAHFLLNIHLEFSIIESMNERFCPLCQYSQAILAPLLVQRRYVAHRSYGVEDADVFNERINGSEGSNH